MKRFVCFLLAMILIMGMVPATAVTAFAASERNTSDKAIQILKGSEAFFAKQESGKIGYGTNANFVPTDSSIPKSFLNSISKEDADALLRNFVKENVDKEINKFTKDYNVDLTQQEHDALAVHMYRSGALKPSTTTTPFVTARIVKSVSTAADRAAMVNAFVAANGVKASNDEYLKAGLNVALAEAAMYLYGDYGYNGNGRFAYAVLDKNDNKMADSADQVVAFVKSEGYNLDPLNNTDFLGWYLYDSTKKAITGSPLSKLTKDHDGKLIVAQKYAGDNVAVDYTINSNTLSDLHRYNGSLAITEDIFAHGVNLKITRECMNSGIKWVFATGVTTKGETKSGWVKIGLLEGSNVDINKPIATATITSDIVKVYPGATSDGAEHVDTLKKNAVVNVYEMKVEKTDFGNKVWGKITYKDSSNNAHFGWINLANATLNETTGTSGSAEGQTGKIANDTEVNIREGAGVNYTKLTALKAGTKVTILEMNADRTWAKIKWSTPSNGYTQGWVYMHYVQLDSATAGSNGSGVDTVQYTGVVTSNINLNVRKSADIYAAVVKTLPYGTKINIYETTTSRNMKWGRIGENQWVCLTYVNLTKVESNSTNNGTANEGNTTTKGTVTTTTLNVLKNYNNNAEKVGELKKGTVVTILEKNTETTATGSRIWGRISENGVAGWINLAYVDLKTITSANSNTGSNTTVTATAGVISDCISVNVRESAGVYSKQITKLNNGTAVTVYEQVTYDNAPWARIKWNNGASEGWICMYYVTLNAGGTVGTTNTNSNGIINGTNSNTISATGYVNNVFLNVRSGAGLNYTQVGTLNQGAKVTLFEQAVADGMIWGRINYNNTTGWVCMSYITVESATSTGKGVMGTVARCFSKANVRSAPGTNNALVATVNVGSRVEVFETRTYSNQLWGRIAQGWICMDYVLLDSELPEGTVLDATTAPTQSTTPATTAPTVNKDNEVAYVINATVNTSEVTVYNDATDKSIKVGTIKKEAIGTLTVLAVKNNGVELWGRIDQYATAGWINLANTSYSVAGYVNTDKQPVYADPNTSSTVKGNLGINTAITIQKLTVNGETVYGWVENGLAGWIPMGRISKDQVLVEPTLPVISDSSVNCAGSISGKVNAALDAYDATNGSKVVAKVKSGATVYVTEINLEAGIVWGKIAYKAMVNGTEVDTAAWINMGKVTYTLAATVNDSNSLVNVRSTKSTADDTNVLGQMNAGDNVQICEISFAADGTPWAKISGVAAEFNGGYIALSRLNTVIPVTLK